MQRKCIQYSSLIFLCTVLLANHSACQFFDAEKLSRNLFAFVDNATNFIKMQKEFEKVKGNFVRVEDEDEL